MTLSIEELAVLSDDIARELPEKLDGILSKLNRSGRLEEFLDIIGMKYLIQSDSDFITYKDGKIVVLGGSEVKEEVLLSVAKKLGLDKKRFEFCLDYEALQKYEYRKMQYSSQYRVILFGPIPHSAHDKGDSGSIVAEIEKSEAYPRCERLMSGQELKISKSNFRDKLIKLIEENYI